MSNKPLYQKLKNTIRSICDQEIDSILTIYESCTGIKIEKQCKMISYKCYEASFSCQNKRANGYGRNEKEAITNCIKNLLEHLIEDETNVQIIIQALKKTLHLDESFFIVGMANYQKASSLGPNTQNPNGVNDTMNRSMTLNSSWMHNQNDNNTSNTHGDIKGRDIDSLSKNMGNVSMNMGNVSMNMGNVSMNMGNTSMMNNSKAYDNLNNSQLEMDSIIMKIMDETTKKNPYQQNVIPNQSQAQCQLSSQQPHNILTNVNGNIQHSTTQNVEIPTMKNKIRNSQVSESLQGPLVYDNLNPSSSSIYTCYLNQSLNAKQFKDSVEQATTTAAAAIAANTNQYKKKSIYEENQHGNMSSYNAINPSKHLNKYQDKSVDLCKEASVDNPKRSNSYKELSNQGTNTCLNTSISNTSKIPQVDNQHTKENFIIFGSGCQCGLADKLAKAQQTIENLEKKIRLLSEENKILKYLTEEKSKSIPKTQPDLLNHSTSSNVSQTIFTQEISANSAMHTATNPTLQNISHPILQNNFTIPSPENVVDDDFKKMQLKTLDMGEKTRSQSVGVNSKSKFLLDQASKTPNINNDKENSQQIEKKDIKKIIPKLRLDMLPNYHLKNTKPLGISNVQLH